MKCLQSASATARASTHVPMFQAHWASGEHRTQVWYPLFINATPCPYAMADKVEYTAKSSV